MAYLEETDKTLTYSRVPHRFNQGGGGGGGGKGGGGLVGGVEETRPGTEKRCSPNLRAEATVSLRET